MNKTHIKPVRFTDSEVLEIESAHKKLDVKFSPFVRNAAVNKAKSVNRKKKESEVI